MAAATAPDGLPGVASDHRPPEGTQQIAPPGSRHARRQSGVRAVLARLPFDLGTQIPDEIQPLIHTLKRNGARVDLKLIIKAHLVADAAHAGQRRLSGEPYIMHPIGVAEILADLGADTPTLCAALLHDVVEDTPSTLDDIRSEFGDATAVLVDGVTKLERVAVQTKEEQQAESLRKMLLAMAEDYRVLLIKLADRLHNMRTIHHMPREKQEQKASETLSIYAPLAHRLGMQQFKWELEDRSFQCMHPKRYDEIKAMVADRQPGRDAYLQETLTEVSERLRAVKIRAQITGRQKHYWSIYEKMVVRGKEFDEIYDLIGVRVIVDSVKDCYAALGTLHAVWRPVPGRFKDYIAMPKFNLYQSLHTTVVGPTGKTMEVQIRTQAMHRTAEFGVAAHWRYKESNRGPGDGGGDAQWLDQMLDMESSTRDSPGEFMRNVQLDLYADEVFVFTPRGDIRQLPRGSTPVDLAYAIHTDVGHRTVGARVNDRLVPLEYELRNGETVEILLSKSKDSGPSRDWLEFVGSARARSKIRSWFSRERREDAIEKGREELRRTLAKSGRGWKRQIASPLLAEVGKAHNYADLDALYRAVGDGHISAKTIAAQLGEKLAQVEGTATPEAEDEEPYSTPSAEDWSPRRSSEAVFVEGIDDVLVTLARCCSPVPRDDIMGFVTRGRGISVHRTDCPNADDLRSEPDRLVPVRWNTQTPSTFRVTIDVEAFDRKHLLRDITTVLGDEHVSIVSANVTTKKDRVALLRFTFELADITHLDHVLRQVKRVEAVYDAYRVIPRATTAKAHAAAAKRAADV
ncbi:MAG TPA: bifunctional (p)ppGpp synthetase/guanosine-3',5'-bis(diphosphate) 3'-pyrophosphohydrolase [Euzebya sp.]|nr:bifunctional (p)ppGpp synthetase/guanosine-3',5'-bis(diphosphate) 3'-pyrophosphohydrolase [Euzebya sp.]